MAEPIQPQSKRMRLSTGVTTEDFDCCSVFGTLPLDVLHQICSYLTTEERLTLRMVSKNLHFFLSDPSFWKVVYISPIESKNVKLVKTAVKLSKPFVTTLSIIGYAPPRVTALSYLHNCHLITSLDLTGSCFTVSAKTELVTKLSNLSRLSIGGPLSYILPKLTSLSQLIVYSECFYQFFHSWSDTDFWPSSVAFISNSTDSISDVTLSLLNACHHEVILSVYQCNGRDTVGDQTSMPFKNIHNQRKILKVETGSADMSVGKAVSTSVLSQNHLYVYSNPVPSDSTIICSTFISSVDVGSTIVALDFSDYDLPVALDNIRIVLTCTPNLLVFSVNGVLLTDPLEPLDELFRLLSVHCKKLRSVFALVKDCYVYDAVEAWKNILSLKNLEHLSLCSCCFMTHCSRRSLNMLRPLDVRFTASNTLPRCFKSIIVKACRSRKAFKYALQDIFTIVSDITHLKCLHVYIPMSSGSISRDVSLRKVFSCLSLEELAICTSIGKIALYEATGIHNLKYLKLMGVHLAVSFFSNLVHPAGRNMCLQTLSLYVHKLPVEQVAKVLEGCPCLVSCEIFFLSTTRRTYASDCKYAKQVAKKLNLLSFNLGRYNRGGYGYKVIRSSDLNNFTSLKKL